MVMQPTKQKLGGDVAVTDQPELVPCTTDESAWDNCYTMNDGFDSKEDIGSSDAANNQEAIDYLLRYEAMVLQQDMEEMATLAYIRPLLERLQTLGRRGKNIYTKATEEPEAPSYSHKDTESNTTHSDLCKREITFGEMKRALSILESDCSSEAEVMTKDRQLMMILRMLTQKLSAADEHNVHVDDEVSITWAEVIHCYRVCIIGLLTLKDLPKPSSVRSRAKERILSQLSLFEVPAKKLQNDDPSSLKPSVMESTELMAEQSARGTKALSLFEGKNEAKLLAIVVGLCLAVVLGFIFGLSYSSEAHSSYTGDTVNFAAAPSTLPMKRIDDGSRKHTSVRTDVVNVTRTVSASRILPATGREDLPVLPSSRSQKSYHPLGAPKLTTGTLVGLASLANHNATGTGTTMTTTAATTSQTNTLNSTILDMQMLPHEQLMVSAGIGGVIGVLATPQIISLGKSIASALSLGSLGLLPGSLVVVGAAAVSSAVVKGVRFILDKYFRKS